MHADLTKFPLSRVEEYSDFIKYSRDNERWEATGPVTGIYLPGYWMGKNEGKGWKADGHMLYIFPPWIHDGVSGIALDDPPTVIAGVVHDAVSGFMGYFKRHRLIAHIMWVQRKRYRKRWKTAVYNSWHFFRCTCWFTGLVLFNWIPVDWGGRVHTEGPESEKESRDTV